MAKETEKEFNNENLLIIKCDVSNEEEVIDMFDKIKTRYCKIDYLVNNAGTFIDNLIKDFDINDFKKVLDINLLGKVICTKHSYPIMSEGGSIVNISSHLGVVPCTESPAYCSAAAAAIIACVLATSERNKEIDLVSLLKKTKYGASGMGGIISNGMMYVGFPR